MSMCVRYAGDSYTYLLESVATDHGRSGPGSPMTRYYAAHGTPPGTWLGVGLVGLNDGRGLPVGSSVTPLHMARLFAEGADPVTGGALGRSPHLYAEGERHRRPVAGFDCTFTVPKSVSVLWALSAPEVREEIYAAHRQTVADIVALIERDVARTRTGKDGLLQVEVAGVIAAAFDHWDSRENDPNLHTHVVLANRVQGPDGRWRTLDSRAIHKATVAMSERYDALLADHLTARLGLAWEYRDRGPARNPAYELAAVPHSLIEGFSRRGAAINVATDQLIEQYAASHGRHPDPAAVLRLRQQATLATRDAKEVHSLADLTAHWRDRARGLLGADPTVWAATALRPAREIMPDEPVLGDRGVVADAAQAVLVTLTTKRSTWTAWNVDAEASRALRAHRFATMEERDAATTAVIGAVQSASMALMPNEPAEVPTWLRRADGSDMRRAFRSEQFSSHALFDAETRLLEAGRNVAGPVAPFPSKLQGRGLYDDQAAAVTAIATSGRAVDVLVGPAGSGKTRTLAELRQVWEAEYGPGSVVGLAPSAAAADVLGSSLGIGCENTAKWLVEHDAEPDRVRRWSRARQALARTSDVSTARQLAEYITSLSDEVDRWRFHPGQLVIIDEASLAGTFPLDRIASHARDVGAKVLLVGDWAQLSSVEAGGGFGLLVRDRGPGAPELGAARRFIHEWEREASTQLRLGDTACLNAYAEHGRLAEGDHTAMIEAAYNAWAADEIAGLKSLLIAGDRDTVRALNERAHVDLVVSGHVQVDGTSLSDGLTAGVGDRIVTRRNDRHLLAGDTWVKNGDVWIVRDRRADGSLVVRRKDGVATATLPQAYVAQYVELGYAATAFRAQGATVDTAHAIITGPGMTREVLYVMLSRARRSNRAYVCVDQAVEPLNGFADDASTGRAVLTAVLGHVGASASAHEVIGREYGAVASVRSLTPDSETVPHLAHADLRAEHLRDAELSRRQLPGVEDSPAPAPAPAALKATMRRAETHEVALDGDSYPPRLGRRLIEGAGMRAYDLVAMLQHRGEGWTRAAFRPGQGTSVNAKPGGLAGAGSNDPDGVAALRQRERLTHRRATERRKQATAVTRSQSEQPSCRER